MSTGLLNTTVTATVLLEILRDTILTTLVGLVVAVRAGEATFSAVNVHTLAAALFVDSTRSTSAGAAITWPVLSFHTVLPSKGLVGRFKGAYVLYNDG